MLTQTQAQLFLADQRGCSQTEGYRSFHTFNFGQYRAEGREPFGTIQAFNDDTLRGGESIKMCLEKPTQILIIPLVGGVIYSDNKSSEKVFIEAGESLSIMADKGTEYEIANPYESEDLVNFLHIWLKNDEPYKQETAFFDLNKKDRLHPFLNEKTGFIGKYKGRGEDVYTLINAQSGILAFVIEGVFEVQNRLLHSRDCLTLWDLEEVEFEALSNDAIILLLETSI